MASLASQGLSPPLAWRPRPKHGASPLKGLTTDAESRRCTGCLFASSKVHAPRGPSIGRHVAKSTLSSGEQPGQARPGQARRMASTREGDNPSCTSAARSTALFLWPLSHTRTDSTLSRPPGQWPAAAAAPTTSRVPTRPANDWRPSGGLVTLCDFGRAGRQVQSF